MNTRYPSHRTPPRLKLAAGTKMSGLLLHPVAAVTLSDARGAVEIAAAATAVVVGAAVAAAAAAAAATRVVAASTRGGNMSCTRLFAQKSCHFSYVLNCRSKKEKKHKKEKTERRHKHSPLLQHTADSAAVVCGTNASPAAAANCADAVRLSAAAASPHVALNPADSASDGDSDYGPAPLVAAVGDVG